MNGWIVLCYAVCSTPRKSQRPEGENVPLMSVKVGINGFGRIGRNVVRAALHNPEIEFVAVNDLTDTKTLAHLTKYDSVLGQLHEEVKVDGDSLVIGSHRI